MEIDNFPDVAVQQMTSRDGCPVKKVTIPEYEAMVFFGDESNAGRITVRVVRTALTQNEIDLGVNYFQAGHRIRLGQNHDQIINLFRACVFCNPFAAGGRYMFGCALFGKAVSSASYDYNLIQQAEREFRISRALGNNSVENENAIVSCEDFR